MVLLLLPFSQPMQMDTSPPSEIEVIREADFLKIDRSDGALMWQPKPEHICRWLYKLKLRLVSRSHGEIVF